MLAAAHPSTELMGARSDLAGRAPSVRGSTQPGEPPSAAQPHQHQGARDGCSSAAAGEARRPLRELSHQQAAVSQAGKQGRVCRGSSQPGFQDAAQAAAPGADSAQGAAGGEPWYTSLHSMRFGGSEFVNSARWFLAGAGASTAAGGRGGEGAGHPGSGLQSNGHSSHAGG